MKINCTLLTGVLMMAMTALTAHAAEERIASPDGKIVVTISDADGRASYQVVRDGVTFIEQSPLGLLLNSDDLTQGLTLSKVESKSIDVDYHLATIKQLHVSHQATEAVCRFQKRDRHVMDIIFHVSNRDVAYRYQIYPNKETLVAVIRSEASSFVLPEGTTTFLCPQSKPMGGFARTSPSYETSYTLDEPTGKNGWGEGYTFPCLFKTGDKGWVLLSETGTDGNYVGW